MRSLIRTAMLALLLIGGTGAARCGEVVHVKISDLAFIPEEIAVHIGDTIEWVNDDFIDHTATAQNGDWDLMVPAGKAASVSLTRAGMIKYFCRFHPNMTGVVRVEGN